MMQQQLLKLQLIHYLAGAAGTFAGAAVSRIHGGKTDVIMMLNGALAGIFGRNNCEQF